MGAPYKIKNTRGGARAGPADRLAPRRPAPLALRARAGRRRPGTKVTETWDISAYPAPLRAVLRALFAAHTQHAVDETLVHLKAAAEADAARAG